MVCLVKISNEYNIEVFAGLLKETNGDLTIIPIKTNTYYMELLKKLYNKPKTYNCVNGEKDLYQMLTWLKVNHIAIKFDIVQEELCQLPISKGDVSEL